MNRQLFSVGIMACVAGMGLAINASLGESSDNHDRSQIDAPQQQPLPETTEMPTRIGPVAAQSPTSVGPATYSDPQRLPGVSTDPFAVPAPILDAQSARVSFQARLTDGNGDPLVGPVNLQFKVYDGGGTAVTGVIALNNVSVAEGVVSVQVPISTNVFNGEARELAVSVNGGAELSPRVPLTAVPYAYRVDRVASEELDDAIGLGSMSPDEALTGNLSLFGEIAGQDPPGGLTIGLEGNNAIVKTFNDDGLVSAELGRYDHGRLLLFDNGDGSSVDRTVFIDATSNTGGQITLSDTDANSTYFVDGGSGIANAVDGFQVVETIGGDVAAQLGRNASNAGHLEVWDPIGNLGVHIGGNSFTGGGFAEYYQQDGGVGLQFIAEAVTGSLLSMYDSSGVITINMDSQDVSGGGAIASFKNSNNSTTILLDADVSNAGKIDLRGPSNDTTLRLEAIGDNGGGRLMVSTPTELVADIRGSTTFGSCFEMYMADGTRTVELFADLSGSTGSVLRMRDGDGNLNIRLDATTGTTRTKILEITGGADLSEQFDVASGDTPLDPGMVVSIDPYNPGKLTISAEAYDAKVAGIISGAGGVGTGMMMSHSGTVADGDHPVALTGRVYCWVDASQGAVKPGDLLTTSSTPGHAMKVTDRLQASGAILGKAMTGLKDGKGLVLVLVSLQ